MTPRIRSCFVALAVLVALTGCGDDDDPAADEDAVDTADTDTDTADGGDGDDDGATSDDEGDPDETETGDEPDTGGDPDDDAYIERAVDDLVSGADVEPDMARCIATAVLDAAGGAEAMRDAGLDESSWFSTPESFEELGLPADDDAVAGLAEGLGECGDGHELLFTTGGPDVTDAVRQCVTDAVGEAEVRRALASSIMRGQDSATEEEDVFSIVRRCEDDAQAG